MCLQITTPLNKSSDKSEIKHVVRGAYDLRQFEHWNRIFEFRSSHVYIYERFCVVLSSVGASLVMNIFSVEGVLPKGLNGFIILINADC
jgi:hypothetical protein